MIMTKNVRNTIILFAVGIIATALIAAGAIDAYTAQIFSLAGINAIMALSVNIICGITGQLSLGQAGFMAIGGYSTILLCTNAHVPLPLAIIIAALITAFFGFLIGFPTLRLEGDYLAIVTLAFGEIIRVFLINLKQWTGGPNGIQFNTIMVFNAAIAFAVVTGTLVLLIALIQNFIRSSYGRAILAVREDEIAANSSGIGVFRYKMIGFVIASFVAGIGGALYVCLVLGGMGSTTGSVLASYVLTYLQEFLRFLQNYRLLFYPVVLIFVMIFRPQGLLGTKEASFVKTFEFAQKFLQKKIKKSKNTEAK